MRLARSDLAIVAAIAATSFIYVAIFHYHAPYYDHWDLVPLFEAADAGALTPARLFAIHGGHWHAGAYALLVPLAQATHWSHLAEALLSLSFVAATCALSLKLAQSFAVEAAPGARFTPYVIAAAFLAFSLDQASNMLWGFQLSVFVSQFGVTLAIAALAGPHLSAARLVAALLGLALAVTSYATGFAVIPIGLALIALRDAASPARRIGFAAIWITLSAALCIVFVLALHSAPQASRPNVGGLVRPEALVSLVLFTMNFLGAGVARFATSLIIPVAAIGIAGASAAAFVLRRRGVAWRSLAIPLSLCAFGVGAGLLCGLGRLDFGADQGANSRYTSFANSFWLGFAMLALAALPHIAGKALRRTLVGVLGALLLLKLGNCVQAGTKHARLSHEIAVVAAAMRDDPANAGQIAAQISAPSQGVGARVAYIRDKRWSAFR